MKFTYKIESSLGHEVISQTIDTNFEMLQDNFREAVRVLENWNNRDLGETEYLYLDFVLENYTDLEFRLFVVFVNFYSEDE
jgi:hypothetical protein